jgi:hypothetical protein
LCGHIRVVGLEIVQVWCWMPILQVVGGFSKSKYLSSPLVLIFDDGRLGDVARNSGSGSISPSHSRPQSQGFWRSQGSDVMLAVEVDKSWEDLC